MKSMTSFMDSAAGKLIVSVVLGLGLACIFRSVCKGDSCIVLKAPDMKEIRKYTYKIDDECWKYDPYASKCDDGDRQQQQQSDDDGEGNEDGEAGNSGITE
jgi:hypothetical protein